MEKIKKLHLLQFPDNALNFVCCNRIPMTKNKNCPTKGLCKRRFYSTFYYRRCSCLIPY